MLNFRNILMALAMAAVSFTVGAQTIYESVDENGVVEYSDMPSEGAKEISVDPNVVDMAPEKRAGASREAAAGTREGAESAGQAEEDFENDDGVDRRQREKMEAKEVAGGIKEEHREGGVQRPANGGLTRSGTRPAGGGRR